MTFYAEQADLSVDVDFTQRVAACAATQEEVTIHPLSWAGEHQWQVSAAPGFADAYASAVAGEVERPGRDPSVITDEQILSAVQAEIAASTEGT